MHKLSQTSETFEKCCKLRCNTRTVKIVDKLFRNDNIGLKPEF